ncbi:oxidoreductase-like protein [Leptotrombidium deliense]|uniref:Oxidoreductase-like protein n=1 Tax=Leptotrombidium deliense TaxID=299467 RepID=A0A443SEY0_9ACAR|nr:oxidoreductase-like protein [Leptotrombidium deliense]
MGLDESANQAFQDACAAVYPLRRVGEPIDIAKAIAYLASDESSWVSGCLLNIDGGSRYTNMPL